MKLTDDLPLLIRSRRVRYDPGRSDWLHEREWRICYRPRDTPELEFTSGLLVGVIVGKRGWVPPPAVKSVTRTFPGSPGIHAWGRTTHVRYSAAADQLARWWWKAKTWLTMASSISRHRCRKDYWMNTVAAWTHSSPYDSGRTGI